MTKPTLQSTIDLLVFAVGESRSISDSPFLKVGVYAVRQLLALWHNIKSLLNGGPLLEFKPQSDFLRLLNTGDGRALLLYRSLTVHARWCWILKAWIDRKFLKHLQSQNDRIIER